MELKKYKLGELLDVKRGYAPPDKKGILLQGSLFVL